jgi:hypothetical protein
LTCSAGLPPNTVHLSKKELEWLEIG